MNNNVNPLLDYQDLPNYSQIKPEHVEPAIDAVLRHNREILSHLTHSAAAVAQDWASLVPQLDAMDEAIERVWSPVNHLNAVCSSPELRHAYESALGKISVYATELGQNKALYKGFKSLLNSPAYPNFDIAQRAVIDHTLRDFINSGIHLDSDAQKRFGDLSLRLSELSSQFANNVLDATQAWSRLLTEENQLAGVPESAKSFMAKCARDQGLQGWLLTLQPPCVQAVLTYADNRELREQLYFNNITRASELGPNAGDFDNGPLIQQIIEARIELARMLGYDNYAQLSLSSKMAESGPQVLDFLRDLAYRSRPAASNELTLLRAFAKAQGVSDMRSWDVGYFSERFYEEHYRISQESLRPYFPTNHVLIGMFALAERLYSVRFKELTEFDSWNSDVRFFEVIERDEIVGRFFLDLYARPNKRAGAWMDGCRSRRLDAQNRLHLPVAYLVCNFTPAIDNAPAQLTHEEIVTLFHEFGHGLHHLLTRVDQPRVAGVNGVAWDAVELPSQFMENWCWQPEVVRSLSCHADSGEPLPDQVLQRLLKSRDYHVGLSTLRQIEFALFDFELHSSSTALNPTLLMSKVREEVSLLAPPSYNRFANTFSHIFAGGYAAGYYSYKWAEVLAADTFSRFLEEGLFNKKVGDAFRETILAWGGAEHAMELFRRFRGRDASIDALLMQSGLKE